MFSDSDPATDLETQGVYTMPMASSSYQLRAESPEEELFGYTYESPLEFADEKFVLYFNYCTPSSYTDVQKLTLVLDCESQKFRNSIFSEFSLEQESRATDASTNRSKILIQNPMAIAITLSRLPHKVRGKDAALADLLRHYANTHSSQLQEFYRRQTSYRDSRGTEVFFIFSRYLMGENLEPETCEFYTKVRLTPWCTALETYANRNIEFFIETLTEYSTRLKRETIQLTELAAPPDTQATSWTLAYNTLCAGAKTASELVCQTVGQDSKSQIDFKAKKITEIARLIDSLQFELRSPIHSPKKPLKVIVEERNISSLTHSGWISSRSQKILNEFIETDRCIRTLLERISHHLGPEKGRLDGCIIKEVESICEEAEKLPEALKSPVIRKRTSSLPY